MPDLDGKNELLEQLYKAVDSTMDDEPLTLDFREFSMNYTEDETKPKVLLVGMGGRDEHDRFDFFVDGQRATVHEAKRFRPIDYPILPNPDHRGATINLDTILSLEELARAKPINIGNIESITVKRGEEDYSSLLDIKLPYLDKDQRPEIEKITKDGIYYSGRYESKFKGNRKQRRRQEALQRRALKHNTSFK